MKYLNKKMRYIIIGIVILMFLILLLSINRPSTEIPKDNVGIQKPPEETIILSNRDIAIKEALENPDKLLRTEINGEIYLLTGYDDTFYGGGPKENKPGWEFGGIIVFKLENNQPVFFWESEEYISQILTRFQDINSDGIDEIVFEYDLGVTGRSNSFYVYKFNTNRFKLITPAKTIELTTSSGTVLKYNRTLLSGIAELTYMEDIDGDGVREIMVGDKENISGDVNNPIYQQYQQIYKYNGDKYYLWKEEKRTEENDLLRYKPNL